MPEQSQSFNTYGGSPTPKAAEEVEQFRLHLLAHSGQTVDGCRFCAERFRRASQWGIDRNREAVAGGVIRRSCEFDADREQFYLKCSVGDLAQRVVIALVEDADG
jgi:hypothetical protein